jgi:hypothetical protein
MRVNHFGSALLVVCSVGLTAQGADLTKIDRTIANEPDYKSHPKYCLLVFGPEAKTRVWLVRDGDILYVDRNGNGDLTEKGERCRIEPDARLSTGWHKCAAGDVVEADGKVEGDGRIVHRALHLHFYSPDEISLKVRAHSGREYCLWWDIGGGIRLSGRRQDSAVVHLDGPLTFGRLGTGGEVVESPTGSSYGQALTRGDKAARLAFQLGTPGLGKDTFASINPQKAVSKSGIRPRAEIEFPAKRPGSEAIRLTLTLAWDP